MSETAFDTHQGKEGRRYSRELDDEERARSNEERLPAWMWHKPGRKKQKIWDTVSRLLSLSLSLRSLFFPSFLSFRRWAGI